MDWATAAVCSADILARSEVELFLSRPALATVLSNQRFRARLLAKPLDDWTTIRRDGQYGWDQFSPVSGTGIHRRGFPTG